QQRDLAGSTLLRIAAELIRRLSHRTCVAQTRMKTRLRSPFGAVRSRCDRQWRSNLGGARNSFRVFQDRLGTRGMNSALRDRHFQSHLSQLAELQTARAAANWRL